MPPKCRVNKTFPAIEKGCKAVDRKEAPPPAALHPNDTPLVRLQRNATRNIHLIREEKETLRINTILEAKIDQINEDIRRNIREAQKMKKALDNNTRATTIRPKSTAQAKALSDVERKTLYILDQVEVGLKAVDDHTQATIIMSKANARKEKANAAATRQRIIGRIKGARSRKTLPVNLAD